MAIIALSGKMRAGKDTFAEFFIPYVKEKYGIEYQRVAFADALKREIAERHQVTIDEINRNKDLYRQELIDYGKLKREEDPMYWIKRAIPENGNIIITDMRHRNEYDYVKIKGHTKFDGIVMVRIEATLEERQKRGQVISDDISETALDEFVTWDHIITNNKTIEEFHHQLKYLSDTIINKLHP